MVEPALDYRKLSIPERVQLVEDIWDSMAQDTVAVRVPEDVLDEAERRLDEHRRDPHSAIPWQDVKADLYKRGG